MTDDTNQNSREYSIDKILKDINQGTPVHLIKKILNDIVESLDRIERLCFDQTNYLINEQILDSQDKDDMEAISKGLLKESQKINEILEIFNALSKEKPLAKSIEFLIKVNGELIHNINIAQNILGVRVGEDKDQDIDKYVKEIKPIKAKIVCEALEGLKQLYPNMVYNMSQKELPLPSDLGNSDAVGHGRNDQNKNNQTDKGVGTYSARF